MEQSLDSNKGHYRNVLLARLYGTFLKRGVLIPSHLGSRTPFQKSIEIKKKIMVKFRLLDQICLVDKFYIFYIKALNTLFLNLFLIFKNPVCSIFPSTQ